MADDWFNDRWFNDRQGKPLRFGRAGRSESSGARRWLGAGAIAVLLLAGGLGWWAAPTDGAMVRAPEPKPGVQAEWQLVQDTAQEGAQPGPPTDAALPGGDIPETARLSSRGRQLLSDEQREVRRFGRQDRNKDGVVSREEFLAARRKSFDRLDKNGDGRLSFEEYAAATSARFAAADRNADRQLSQSEFAATASQRPSAASGRAGGRTVSTGRAAASGG